MGNHKFGKFEGKYETKNKTIKNPRLYTLEDNKFNEKVNNLLKLGANPNIFDEEFEATPLFVAAQNGNFKIVKR